MPREPRSDGPKLRSQVLSTKRDGEALISSARRMDTLPNLEQRSSSSVIKMENWQPISWNFYDTISEYRYSVDWVGNLLSKATLELQYDGKPATNKDALEYLAALYGGNHAEMLRQFATHLTVAGDCYLVGSEDGGEDDWVVASSTELKKGAGDEWELDGDTYHSPLVIRMWRPHPRKPKWANSPSRAVLPILAEIDGLTKHVAAQIDSRLISAGILLLPSEVSFGAGVQAVPGVEGATAPATATPDSIVAQLIAVASAAISDRSDASALVPLVMQMNGEFIDKVKHLTFWSPLDEKSIELRTEAIRRLAMGMDMPPEVLTGTADMNHWNAWQVEEASIKAHSEPFLEVITSALTTGYLHGLLKDDNMADDEIAKYKIVANTTKLRLRPNRSKESIELYDRGELSGAAVVRENGFEESDRMSPEEFLTWLTKRVAGGSTTPELVQAALERLGVQLEVTEAAAPVQEARPARSIAEHPVNELPEEQDGDAIAAAASWVFCYRALERAGNRMRSKMGAKIAGVTAFDTYRYAEMDLGPDKLDFLLEDAWTPAGIWAKEHGYDPDTFTAALDSYVESLIVSRTALSEDGVASVIKHLSTPIAA